MRERFPVTCPSLTYHSATRVLVHEPYSTVCPHLEMCPQQPNSLAEGLEVVMVLSLLLPFNSASFMGHVNRTPKTTVPVGHTDH